VAAAGLVALGLLASRPPVAAQTGTAVGPWPRQAYTEPDETVSVTIHVADVENLYGADVRLAFDPDVVQVVDANPNRAGVQIQPLSEFLSPDMVLLNSADNDAGTIQYAATQVNPSPPVSGSGSLAEIVFQGSVAGTSAITVTYRKIVRSDGSSISNTAVDGFIAVGPAVPTLSIAKGQGSTASLTWTESFGASEYALYRGTDAYFIPTGTPLVVTDSLGYDDEGALGGVAENYTYVVKAVAESGLESAASNRVAEFDFSLSPGQPGGARRYNLIGVPLAVPSVTDAGTLAAYVGSGVYNVLRYLNASQSIEYWLPGLGIGHNFPVTVGGPYYLHLDATAAVTVTFTGGVPQPGAAVFSFARPDPGQSCKYNYLTVPFEKSALATADALAADIGGVYMVIRYDAPSQSIQYRLPGLAGQNFQVRAGYPYIVCLQPSAPDQWP